MTEDHDDLLQTDHAAEKAANRRVRVRRPDLSAGGDVTPSDAPALVGEAVSEFPALDRFTGAFVAEDLKVKDGAGRTVLIVTASGDVSERVGIAKAVAAALTKARA